MGTGWLVTPAVVWFLTATGTGLWSLAMMNDPAGQGLPDGAMRYLAATVYVSGVRADRAWKRAGVGPPGRLSR